MSRDADDYDFSKGVRGKYRHVYGQARTLKICHPDGSVTVQTVPPVKQRNET